MNIPWPDTYALRARLIPAVIAMASIIALALVLVRYSAPGLPEIAGGVISLALISTLSDFARRQGQRIEPGLFTEMSGKPSTTMLRHRDATIAPDAKASLHGFLGAAVKLPAPTLEDEADDPARADAFYESGGDWLRAHTGSDKKRFHLVFAELITYGFRRNLYGLKWIGIAVAILAGGFSAGMLYFPEYMPESFNRFDALKGVIVLSAVQALYFIFIVTRRSLAAAARTYARQLLLSQHLFETPLAGSQ